MSSRKLLKIVPLLLVLVAFWGCEPEDPGSPLANLAPETRIVVAPLDSVEHDHYVSPSSMFHVQWFGHDQDGLVEGFWVWVDRGDPVWTTKGDSVIAFESKTIDPNDPERMLETHTIYVAAQDNLGRSDPSPASRTIKAINYQPQIDKFVADFPDLAVVGTGISFEVEWSDPDESGALFRVMIDGFPITDWVEYSEFQFYDTSNDNILASIDTIKVLPLDVSFLNVGDTNTIGVEVMDLGGSISDRKERRVIVTDNVYPRLTAFSAVYGTADFFPDGSIFYRDNRTTILTMEAATECSSETSEYEDYFGDIQAYRYRFVYRLIGETTWPEWSDDDWYDWGAPSVEFDNLDPGEYKFNAQCRDFAGAVSDTLSIYTLSIVIPDLEQMNILIVDETKDGNGRPGSPDDEQCDNFYDYITSPLLADGWSISTIDYASHAIGDVNYVSPLDVYNKRIIIWHADDRSQFELKEDPNNLILLGQYLDSGGKLILSGWDVLSAFTEEDSPSFSSGFANNYLRIASGKKNALKEFVGMTGNADIGSPDVAYDPAKIPGGSRPWLGVPSTWILTPEHRTEAVGYWNGNPDTTIFEGGVCCLRNFSPIYPYRTMVLGFPLYFMYENQAREFLLWAVNEIEAP
ncbi:hypothetical protein HQ587_08750 [bacterium]|nr:hypothetical protein [bacterium]